MDRRALAIAAEMRGDPERAALHKRAWRNARRAFRVFRWQAELRRIRALHEVGKGRRAFLIGNGPSLNRMDLSRLGDEFICVVNRGLRAVGHGLDHADMHVVNDIHCYRFFAEEIEAIAARHPIPYRFLNARMRRRWRRKHRGGRPYFLIGNPRKLTAGEAVPDLSDGVVTGPSILLSAVHLLDSMGFGTIYVIGCDLDYNSAGPYFFGLDAADIAHEESRDILARRQNMTEVDGQFAIVRAHLEGHGRKILNAGIGGNLNSLPRVDFASLFTGEPDPRVGASDLPFRLS